MNELWTKIKQLCQVGRDIVRNNMTMFLNLICHQPLIDHPYKSYSLFLLKKRLTGRIQLFKTVTDSVVGTVLWSK